jgi:hypothetical protein
MHVPLQTARTRTNAEFEEIRSVWNLLPIKISNDPSMMKREWNTCQNTLLHMSKGRECSVGRSLASRDAGEEETSSRDARVRREAAHRPRRSRRTPMRMEVGRTALELVFKHSNGAAVAADAAITASPALHDTSRIAVGSAPCPRAPRHALAPRRGSETSS